MLLSSKCDTSGCQGCWHHCLLQRPFSGRADWKEVSLVNAIPATSLWGWARAGRCQQDSRPVVLQSWAAVASLLALLACFMPSSHVWFHPPWCTLSHPPASNWCRQTSVSAAFLLFEQKVSSGQWGHVRNMSLPWLLTAMRGTRRPPHKEMGRAKILLNREAKKGGMWNLVPTGQRQISHEIPWGQSFCTKNRGQKDPGAWKRSKGSWLFVFLVVLQIKHGKYKIFYALAETCFSSWERK